MILIVRHGPGRGRLHQYLEDTLTHLRETRPALVRQIQVYETGQPPPSLDGIQAVVFALGDPLREWYPACYDDAVVIAERAREAAISIINPPEALSNCIKTVQSRLWLDANIPTPVHLRFENTTELAAILADVTWPVIVRPDEAHAQAATRVCHDRAEAEQVIVARYFRFPGSVTPLIDTREGYRQQSPRSVWARYYHKKRVIALGSVLHRDHLFFSEGPIVGAESSTFARDDKARRPWLLGLNRRHRACVAADLAYWRGGDVPRELVIRALGELGLQLAAIDYSEFADGGIVIWEANPHFYIPPDEVRMLGRKRRGVERNVGVHEAFGDFFEELLR